MRLLTSSFLLFLLLGVNAAAQQNFRINSQGAGGAKLDMTVAQARKIMKGCRFSRGSDGEGVALIDVKCRKVRTMTIYAGEGFVEKPVDFQARIEMIEIWDKRFRTAQGVYVGIRVADAERRLGKVKEIVLTQTESREFITFSKKTPNVSYRFYGGIYRDRSGITTRYERNATLWSIQVSR